MQTQCLVNVVKKEYYIVLLQLNFRRQLTGTRCFFERLDKNEFLETTF